MKNIIALFILMFSAAVFAQNGQIHLQVENISNNDGVISIAVYDNAKDFTKKEIKSLKVQAEKGAISTIIKDLKPGNYAVAILHDENNNDKMDFNMVGIPKEDYGFSNNAKGIMGPPKFKDSVFMIKPGEKKKLQIKL